MLQQAMVIFETNGKKKEIPTKIHVPKMREPFEVVEILRILDGQYTRVSFIKLYLEGVHLILSKLHFSKVDL